MQENTILEILTLFLFYRLIVATQIGLVLLKALLQLTAKKRRNDEEICKICIFVQFRNVGLYKKFTTFFHRPDARYQISWKSVHWFQKRRFWKGFKHIWAWRPSGSCGPDAANKLSFPLPMGAPHKSCL